MYYVRERDNINMITIDEKEGNYAAKGYGKICVFIFVWPEGPGYAERKREDDFSGF